MTGDEARRQIGPGEVDAAAPWDTLTAEQRDFQAHKMAIHAAMVHRMDIEVGRLINRLRAQRVLDDTLIVFLSDNGASAEMMVRADGHDPAAAPGSWRSHLCLGPGWASAANSPFRLHKSFIHEGGIASPMIAHWPAGIRATNRLRHTPAHFVDILPTFLSQAGVTPQLPPNAPPLPGRDLSPALTRDVAVPRDHIFFHHMDNRGLRQGQWKIVSAGKDAPWELYDLTRDRGETTNLAAGQPDRLGAMTSRWNELEARFRAQHRSGVA
jgi:arylsulfatase